MVAPTAYVPIIVGISGKRDLEKEEEEVRQRLAATFAAIEVEFPSSPLVLLTGLAAGADTLAAETALARSRWTAIGLLPFDRELFLEDFSPGSEERTRFEAILERQDGRVMVKTMAPLRDQSGGPILRNTLHRSSDPPNELRRQHYEQVGLVIADRCNLLIVVARRSESPAKIGGTARVAAFKQKGWLDDEAARIMSASDEIAAPERLDRRMRGLIHLIALDDLKAPVGEVLPSRPKDAWQALLGIERFNKTLRSQAGARAADHAPTALTLINADEPDPARDYASRVRAAISDIQRSQKARFERSLNWLAWLFVASILAFQAHAEINPGWFELYGAYLAMLAAGLFLYLLTRRSQWQLVAEDYRGTLEALRVQIEWWRVGLRGPLNRVDRYYLARAERQFAVLRRNIKAGLDAAELLSPRRPKGGEPLDLDSDTGWIPGQMAFFTDRGESRERMVVRRTSIAWFLFQISIGTAFAVGALVCPSSARILVDAIRGLPLSIADELIWLPVALASVIVARLILLLWVRVPLPHPWKGRSPTTVAGRLWQALMCRVRYVQADGKAWRPHSGNRGWFLAVPLGVAAVIGIIAIELVAGLEAQRAVTDAKAYATLFMVMSAVVAAAVRFVMERRGLEAEAHAYRDMRAAYAIAEQHAREVRADAAARPDAAEWILGADQVLARELGRAALAENEGWLRAHRERPIEPLI